MKFYSLIALLGVTSAVKVRSTEHGSLTQEQMTAAGSALSQLRVGDDKMPTPEEIMKFVDTNEDGNIDWFEYGAALAKLCEKHNYEPSGWDYATATALYLYTDVNRNGLVSFKEL